MSVTRGRGRSDGRGASWAACAAIMLYVWANFHADVPRRSHVRTFSRSPRSARGERLWRFSPAGAHAAAPARRALQPGRVVPREEAVSWRRASRSARSSSVIPTRRYAPRARFLIGEAFYREAEFDKAIKEFEIFLAFYPRHQIADLVQYRLAMSYYDQMKPVEQDQAHHREGARSVQEARHGVPRQPLRHRRARQDRHLPRPARPEGSVGRELLLQPGQRERGPPAAGVRAEGVPAHAGDPGDALHAGRGQLRRGQGRGSAASCSGSSPSSTPTPSGDAAPRQRLRTAAR